MTIGGTGGRGDASRQGGRRALLIGLICGLLLAGAGLSSPATAQSAPPAVTSVGTLTLLWALPHGTGSGTPLIRLTTDSGEVFQIEISEETLAAAGGLMKFDRKRVQVSGTEKSASAATGDRPVIQATAIQPAAGASPTPAPITGQQRFVSILCRFADSTGVTPRTPTYFSDLLGTTYPGINNFWRENSFGLINNDGSSVVGWLNLPNPRSYYVFDNAGRPGINFDRLAGDCTAAADASVNFNDFLGINLMFNDLLDCCAWGGSTVLTRDGTTKAWPATWMPPWGYGNQDVLGHEMGHAYGLPHSGGQYGDAYDSQWDVMSSGGTCSPRNTTYGCIAVHTIGYHKDQLGWIPAARKYTAAPNSDQTIYLEDLAAPAVTSAGYQLAKIPINGSTTNFYTVEARKFVGYDQQIPGEAVVIHEVNTSRERPAQVVDPDNNGNPNDAGAMWTPGETFAGNGVRVNVVSSDANGFQVNIKLVPIVPPDNDDFPGMNVPPPALGSPRSFIAITSAATVQTGEPSNVCVPAAAEPSLKKAPLPAGVSAVATGKTAWYRFTAPKTDVLTVDTAGSGFDTVLAVFTGSAVNSLTPVPGACNDDANGTYQSLVSFSATNGTTYYVQVGGYSGASGSLAIKFSGDFVPRPANDDFPGADVLPWSTSAPHSFTVNTETASSQSGEPADVCSTAAAPAVKKPAPAGVDPVPTSKTVWYRFTAPGGAPLTIDTAASDFDTVLAVFTGSAVNALTAVSGACNDDFNGSLRAAVTFTPASGTTYYVQVGGYSGSSGNLGIQFTGGTPPVAPSNDNFPGTTVTPPLASAPRSFTANTAGATTQSGEPANVCTSAAASSKPAPASPSGPEAVATSKTVWYRFLASAGGELTIDTAGSDFDTVVAVFTGGAVNSLTAVPGACNDDSNSTYQSKVVFTPAGGTTYYVQVGGYNGASGNLSIQFRGNFAGKSAVSDYNGDGKTDFGIYRPSNGGWYVALTGGGATSASWGASGDVPVAGDYNGDGKADFGIYRPSTGGWYVALTGGGSTSATWGISTDVPVPGDYDGDGKTDFGIYRPSNGGWYVALAAGGSSTATWGTSTDVPVPGDYNGDGKTDFGIYRPSTGGWYVALAGGGSASASWGTTGDVPVPGDYNGDGKTDFGIYRPSDGGWYVALTGGGSTTATWGASGDVPAPGDYNGDGKTDFGIFRPSNGGWYVALAGGGSTTATWGASGDIPLPLPYAVWKRFYGPA